MPQKTSPRTGPLIAPPVSCATNSRRTLVGRGEPLVGFEPDRDAETDESAVDRKAPLRGQHDPFRADRTVAADLAEKYIRRVLPAQRSAGLRILLHPGADRGHRHLVARDHAAFDQQAPDRDIGMPVLPVIADPDGAAAAQPDPARALDLQKECVDRIVDPKQLETAAGERAILDLGARRARPRAEIGRLAVDRRLIAAMRAAASR